MNYEILDLAQFKREPKQEKQKSNSGSGLRKSMLKHKIHLNAKIINNGNYRYIDDIVYVSDNVEKFIVIDRFINKVHSEINYNNDFIKLISCNGERIAWNR